MVSSGHRAAKLDFSDLQSERRYRGQAAYNASKLALVVFTYELARRVAGIGIDAHCVDPGFVRTGLGRTLPLGYQLAGMALWPFMASAGAGAAHLAWAATTEALDGKTGTYLKKDRPVRSSKPTYDEQLALLLWKTTENLTATPAPGGR